MAPRLVTIRGVELAKLGTWACSNGVYDFTLERFMAAVDAQHDPDIPPGPIKIGHTDPRFDHLGEDGEPAFGWVDNIRVVGASLLGDLVQVPESLAELMPTVYPNRSIELALDVHTPAGRRYPAAVFGLALLGVSKPAVAGLADVADYYSGARPFELATARARIVHGGLIHVLAGMPAASATAPKVQGHTAGAPLIDRPLLEEPMAVNESRLRELLGIEANADAEQALIALRDRAALAPAAATPPPAAPAAIPGTGPFLYPPAPVPAPVATPAAPAPVAGGPAPVPPVPVLNPTTGQYELPAQPAAVPAPAAAPAPAPVAAAPAPVVGAPAPAPVAIDAASVAAAVAAQLQPLIASAAAPGLAAAEAMRIRDRESFLAGQARRGALRPADIGYFRSQYDQNAVGTIAHLSAAPSTFPTFELGQDQGPGGTVEQTAAADKAFLSSLGISD